MTRRFAALLAVVAVAAAPVPSLAEKPAPVPAAKAESGADEDFREGYRLFSKKKHLDACARLYAFLSQRSSNDENYDWARFFLGISLYELGFSHAAADTLSELVARKPNVRVVSYSLEVLEDITRTKPFDWETIVFNGLVDQDFGFVEGDLADFVHYYQGLYDWRHGYLEWGGSHFRAIRKGSYYHGLYLFQKALRVIDENRLQEAEAGLRAIISDPRPPEDLKDQARVTLARILYEQQRFAEARAAYREVRMPPTEQAKYLLEQAWAQYREGRPERAMGLLYAFMAPSFWRHFTPEYYVLKSLIYKKVCQYQQSLSVVGEFKTRYGDSLKAIYKRGDALESDLLVQAAGGHTRPHTEGENG